MKIYIFPLNCIPSNTCVGPTDQQQRPHRVRELLWKSSSSPPCHRSRRIIDGCQRLAPDPTSLPVPALPIQLSITQ